MTDILLEYINKRIQDLTAFKSETLNSLNDVAKTVDELSLIEEEKIVEDKMKFYSASGALEELVELKRVLENL